MCRRLVLSCPLHPKPPLSKSGAIIPYTAPHFPPLMSSPTSSRMSTTAPPLYHLPCAPHHCQVSFHTPATRQRLHHADVSRPKHAKIKLLSKRCKMSFFRSFFLVSSAQPLHVFSCPKQHFDYTVHHPEKLTPQRGPLA